MIVEDKIIRSTCGKCHAPVLLVKPFPTKTNVGAKAKAFDANPDRLGEYIFTRGNHYRKLNKKDIEKYRRLYKMLINIDPLYREHNCKR